MVRRGYVSTTREAFDRYLDTDDYQRIERFKADARICVEAIQSAGGYAALAHPYQTKLEDDALEALVRQLNREVWEGISLLHDPSVQTSSFFDVYAEFFPD